MDPFDLGGLHNSDRRIPVAILLAALGFSMLAYAYLQGYVVDLWVRLDLL